MENVYFIKMYKHKDSLNKSFKYIKLLINILKILKMYQLYSKQHTPVKSL